MTHVACGSNSTTRTATATTSHPLLRDAESPDRNDHAGDEDAANRLAIERLHIRVANFGIVLGALALVMLAINQIFFLDR